MTFYFNNYFSEIKYFNKKNLNYFRKKINKIYLFFFY